MITKMRIIKMLKNKGEKKAGKKYVVSKNEAWALVENEGVAVYIEHEPKELTVKKRATKEIVASKPKSYITK